jgi:hypothetical protein
MNKKQQVRIKSGSGVNVGNPGSCEITFTNMVEIDFNKMSVDVTMSDGPKVFESSAMIYVFSDNHEEIKSWFRLLTIERRCLFFDARLDFGERLGPCIELEISPALRFVPRILELRREDVPTISVKISVCISEFGVDWAANGEDLIGSFLPQVNSQIIDEYSRRARIKRVRKKTREKAVREFKERELEKLLKERLGRPS